MSRCHACHAQNQSPPRRTDIDILWRHPTKIPPCKTTKLHIKTIIYLLLSNTYLFKYLFD
jgi:hypothetical protein